MGRRRPSNSRTSGSARPGPPRRRPGGGLVFRWRLSPRRTGAILAAIALLAVALIGGLLFRDLPPGGGPAAGPRTAAIVDQLSLTKPNPDFVEATTATLKQAGYEVDYFPGERVTVGFYAYLPTFDYDLIILRVHSGITREVDVTTGERTKTEYVSLFTGEPYSEDRYVREQLIGVARGVYYEGADPLFGIGPRFVADIMRGRFDKTLIIMMGCDGLRSQRTAQAFLDKGASAFVSWSESVLATHTDATTERLLELLLLDGLTPEDAVSQTAAEVGPDPLTNARLRILTGGE